MPEPQRTDGGGAEGEDSVSSVRIHTPLGLNSSPRASPATLGGEDLDGPGPHQWAQTIFGGFFGFGPILGPLVPLGPQQNWAQGASNSPHGLGTPAYGPRPADQRTPRDKKWPKWPYITKSPKITINHKKAQKAIKSSLIKIHHSRGHSPKTS
ncbi:hypothetical protein O181_131396 [Austropuccinia psidii MF-1]|uniref:Uncharacterized protein n=1 Tax=Austropuccinia psidii MF-1 TaxID=1389203 RepID=A0A9Q3QAA2_9BASI|nr:hypothetical protein [Austropuccinia psidii MF-1]